MMRQTPGNYGEAVRYIEELPKFTEKHTLEHTKAFLRYLGNPGKDARVIHVAGTNGKGSVCAYMQAILEMEGKRTGFFTSPHLVRMNERIQIDRKMISDGKFYAVFLQVHEAVRRFLRDGYPHPSYFEFLFGMGMCAFEDAQVDYVILETGLGGRLDATNAPEKPFLTVITSISLDHTEILGNTIEQIAWEKAGIIKPGIPVFFDGSNERAGQIIRGQAEKQGAPCREISKNAFEIQKATRDSIAFLRRNAYDNCSVWRVPGCGLYQVMNAELALQAMEAVFGEHAACYGKWKDAIAGVRWEGRMETVAPHFLLDGAHNPGAVHAFIESVEILYPEYWREGFPEEKLPVLIFSAVSDKDYRAMAAELCRRFRAKVYIVSEIEDKRKVPVSELAQVFKEHTKKEILECREISEAVHTAYAIRGDSEIFCIGSLYLAGMVKKYLQEGKTDVRL